MKTATRVKKQRIVEREETILPNPDLSDEDYARMILNDATKEIEKGWTQGRLVDINNNVCAIGAINRVTRRKEYRGHGRRGLAIRLLAQQITGKIVQDLHRSGGIHHYLQRRRQKN